MAGEAVERGLQPGTGSTDLPLSAFRYGSKGEKTGWFMQAQGHAALTSHDAFRPGASLTTTFGVRLLNAQRVVPQLQLNARIEGRESGANADRDKAGAHLCNAAAGKPYFRASISCRGNNPTSTRCARKSASPSARISAIS